MKLTSDECLEFLSCSSCDVHLILLKGKSDCSDVNADTQSLSTCLTLRLFFLDDIFSVDFTFSYVSSSGALFHLL